jgi:hypothetical protein
MQSHPYDILPWRRVHDNIELLSQEKVHTLHNDWEDQMEISSNLSMAIDVNTTDTAGSSSNKSHEWIPTHPGTNIISGAISLQTDDARKRTHATLQQKRITDWTIHRPFYNGISTDIGASIPEGHTPPKIDTTRTLRIVMQNPQFSLQLTNENYNTLKLTKNLKELSTAVFVAISPNVNWHNPSHRAKFKYPFNHAFKQVHLSSTSSEVGLLPNYISSQNLTGGVAILTFDHWASKVHKMYSDPRGHGTYTITTLQGKNGRFLSIIGAYISVIKGSKAGVNTVHSQQVFMMEKDAIKKKQIPSNHLCPRKEAIKALSQIIGELQSQDHAIILTVDANQSVSECHSNMGLKTHTIEWLRIEHGLDDPFITLQGSRPTSTTNTPHRDIDYILTYGIQPQGINLLPIDYLTPSDHRGIYIDLNIEDIFQAKYSELSSIAPRKLTLRNIQAKIAYIKYLAKQMAEHKILDRAMVLHHKAITNTFTDTDEVELNALDRQISDIMLTGERLCAKDHKTRNPWSPITLTTGGTLSYWKTKMRMIRTKNLQWHRLDNLCKHLNISDMEHSSLCIQHAREKLRNARKAWREVKRESRNLRDQFLSERAEEYAAKMKTDKATTLKMIKKSEEQKQTYIQIREIAGSKKEKSPLTLDILNDNSTKMTLTTKEEIEPAIMARNQRHSRQALQTPFAMNKQLSDAIDPFNSNNMINEILKGTFLDSMPEDIPLNGIERQWIMELKQRMDTEIDTHISGEDFKSYFKHRKEKTASSFLGRHMGHYKVIAELTSLDDTMALILTTIINTAILSSHPLHRWKRSVQVMLEKGKGRYVEHLRIIQLCEADLNFVLKIIWGYRLIRSAQKEKQLDLSQYAVPGQTCHSAVWNKTLYCD